MVMHMPVFATCQVSDMLKVNTLSQTNQCLCMSRINNIYRGPQKPTMNHVCEIRELSSNMSHHMCALVHKQDQSTHQKHLSPHQMWLDSLFILTIHSFVQNEPLMSRNQLDFWVRVRIKTWSQPNG